MLFVTMLYSLLSVISLSKPTYSEDPNTLLLQLQKKEPGEEKQLALGPSGHW